MIKSNVRGQALVEFVIILPIFIFMILAVIDLGKILYYKNSNENKIEDIIMTYEDIKSPKKVMEQLDLNQNIYTLNVINNEKYINFELERSVDIITPGLNIVLGSPYKIVTKRVIYDES